MSEWISVEDRLPEGYGLFLAYCTCGVCLCFFGRKWEYFRTKNEANPTHWMPLPEMPECSNHWMPLPEVPECSK